MFKSLIKCIVIAVICFCLTGAIFAGYLWYTGEQVRAAQRADAEAASAQRAAAALALAAVAKQEQAKQEQAAAASAAAAAAAAAEAKLIPVELRRDWYRIIPSISPLYRDQVDLYIRFTATNMDCPSNKTTIKVLKWEKRGLSYIMDLGQNSRVIVGPLLGGDRREVSFWNGDEFDCKDTVYAR